MSGVQGRVGAGIIHVGGIGSIKSEKMRSQSDEGAERSPIMEENLA